MSPKQIRLVFVALLMGLFLSSLDSNIVSTSIRTIADDLNGLSQQAWVTTAYLITGCISTPIYGKLSDIFGRRRLFLIAISIFLIGSLLSGLSTSMLELTIFRALQGLGGGGLLALALTITGDLLSPRERAKYQGFFLSVYTAASFLGPLIGGALAGTGSVLGVTGWRWVFLVNLPVGAVALFLVAKYLRVPPQRRSTRIDWRGAVMVIFATVPLILVAQEGRNWGWGSLPSIGCYLIGGLAAVVFVTVQQRMGDDALIPLKLFLVPTFAMATFLSFLVGFARCGALLTLPLYLQIVTGETPAAAGFEMLPVMVGLMIASTVSGQMISRTGKYKIYPVAGAGFMIAGYVWLLFSKIDYPPAFFMVGIFLIGVGIGLIIQTLSLASQNAVEPEDMGVATAAGTFVKAIGNTLGAAVILSVLFSIIPSKVEQALADPAVISGIAAATSDPHVTESPVNEGVLAALNRKGAVGASFGGDTSFLTGADSRLTHPFLVGFNDAATTVFWLCLGIVAVVFVLSLFMRAPALRLNSAAKEIELRDRARASRASRASKANLKSD